MRVHHVALMVSIVGAACIGVVDSARAVAISGPAALACTEAVPGDEPQPTISTPDAMPDGFGRWLAQQCPDGVLVVAKDATTATCEKLRETALADEPTRAKLVDA